MSLQAKIKNELDSLAVRIVRKALTCGDEKMADMAAAYFQLKKLLLKAEELETK